MSLMFQGAVDVDDGTIISDGLLARWKLGGNLLDSVGTANGTLVGSGASIGSSGLAMTGGADGGAKFGNHDWFSGAGRQFSVSFRVYVNSLTNTVRLFTKTAKTECGVNQREIYMAIGPRFFFRIYESLTGSTYRQIRTVAELSAGVQYNMAIVYDGTKPNSPIVGRFTLYLNGAEEPIEFASSAGGTFNSILESPAEVALGTYVQSSGAACGGPEYTDATMQDTRVYGRVLTPAEAISITNGTG